MVIAVAVRADGAHCSHTRKDGLTLGQFPVNLRTHASVDICSLTSFLSQLISPSQVLELTIASLNNATNVYSPVSHDESLDAGRLQLPAHSLVLVDETKMDEGKLESHGLRNLNSLAKTMGEAKLDYIFPFSQFCFDVDFNHIVFSKSKSLLPVGHVVLVVCKLRTDT